MKARHALLDHFRLSHGEAQNALIDSLLAGRVSRRAFMRHGSRLGLSLATLSTIAGSAGFLAEPRLARAAGGGTVRVAQFVPASAIDPVKVADGGGLAVLSYVGDFLCFDRNDLTLEPMLAESWTPNKDGTVWTFKLRQGVKFHNGKPMTADDVVASIERLADPANGSNALSVFTGYLSKGGTRKVDDHTVEFHLDAANGSFPYLRVVRQLQCDHPACRLCRRFRAEHDRARARSSSRNIPRKSVRPSSGTRNIGAARWRRNASRRRSMPISSRRSWRCRAGRSTSSCRCRCCRAWRCSTTRISTIISLPSTAHQQLHMSNEMEPFKDPRVRRAVALTLDRPKLVQGLMKGRAKIGNDSPFAGVYPIDGQERAATRKRHCRGEGSSWTAAGMANGFETTLTTERYLEIPDYAVLVQNAVKEIGGKINLNVLDQGAYYGDAVYGKSPWLDSVMGITDYGHRGVPNVFLAAPLRSDGTWNAAHFKNKDYDQLVTSYIASLDLEAQQAAAGKIQRLLLEETP